MHRGSDDLSSWRTGGTAGGDYNSPGSKKGSRPYVAAPREAKEGNEGFVQGNQSHNNSNNNKGGSSSDDLSSLERSMGMVVSLRESFGFLRTVDRPQQMFFHVSEVPDDNEGENGNHRDIHQLISVGQEVEFYIAPPYGKANREMAKSLKFLQRGTVQFDTIQPGSYLGTVKELPRKQKNSFLLGFILVNSDDLDADKATDAEGRKVEFRNEDMNRMHLSIGDTVRFKIAVSKATGIERAIEIRKESFVVNNEEVKIREEGIISTLNVSFGFIKCAEREGRVFFHFHDVQQSPLYDNLRPGMHVKFCYMDDPKTKRSIAREIEILPMGTVKMVEEFIGTYRGVVSSLEDNGLYIRISKDDLLGLHTSGVLPELHDDGSMRHLFFARSLEVPSTCSFSVGDSVKCSIGKERRNKKLVAFNLCQISDQERETGVITRLHDSYGFIRCSQRDYDIFFHFKELPHSATELKVGDGIEFQVQHNPRSDRLQATGLKMIDSSEVAFLTIDERIQYGHVERRYDSRNTYSSSEGALGRVSYRVLRTKEEMELARNAETDGYGNDDLVHDAAAAETEGKLKISTGDAPNQDNGTEKNGCTAGPEDTMETTDQAKEEGRGVHSEKWGHGHIREQESNRFGLIRRLKISKYKREFLPYYRGDTLDGDPFPKSGDLVQFCTAVENRSGNMRATRLKTRLFTGKVDSYRGKYGVIEFYDAAEAATHNEDQDSEKTEHRNGNACESSDVNPVESETTPDRSTKLKLRINQRLHTKRAAFTDNAVVDKVSLNVGDEVEFICTLTAKKELYARRIVRIKEATVAHREIAARSPALPTFRMAKGPDGSKGFAIGRGKCISKPQESHEVQGEPDDTINTGINNPETEKNSEQYANADEE